MHKSGRSFSLKISTQRAYVSGFWKSLKDKQKIKPDINLKLYNDNHVNK